MLDLNQNIIFSKEKKIRRDELLIQFKYFFNSPYESEEVISNIISELKNIKETKSMFDDIFKLKIIEFENFIKRFTSVYNYDNFPEIYIKMPKLVDTGIASLFENHFYWIISREIRYGNEYHSTKFDEVNDVVKMQFINNIDYIKFEYLKIVKKFLEKKKKYNTKMEELIESTSR